MWLIFQVHWCSWLIGVEVVAIKDNSLKTNWTCINKIFLSFIKKESFSFEGGIYINTKNVIAFDRRKKQSWQQVLCPWELKSFVPTPYGLSVCAPGILNWLRCGSSRSVCHVLSPPDDCLCLDVSVPSKGGFQSYLLCLSGVSLDLWLSVLDLSQIDLVRLKKNGLLVLIAYFLICSQFWKIFVPFVCKEPSCHTQMYPLMPYLKTCSTIFLWTEFPPLLILTKV